jgi:hypothetical protein
MIHQKWLDITYDFHCLPFLLTINVSAWHKHEHQCWMRNVRMLAGISVCCMYTANQSTHPRSTASTTLNNVSVVRRVMLSHDNRTETGLEFISLGYLRFSLCLIILQTTDKRSRKEYTNEQEENILKQRKMQITIKIRHFNWLFYTIIHFYLNI